MKVVEFKGTLRSMATNDWQVSKSEKRINPFGFLKQLLPRFKQFYELI